MRVRAHATVVNDNFDYQYGTTNQSRPAVYGVRYYLHVQAYAEFKNQSPRPWPPHLNPTQAGREGTLRHRSQTVTGNPSGTHGSMPDWSYPAGSTFWGNAGGAPWITATRLSMGVYEILMRNPMSSCDNCNADNPGTTTYSEADGGDFTATNPYYGGSNIKVGGSYYTVQCTPTEMPTGSADHPPDDGYNIPAYPVVYETIPGFRTIRNGRGDNAESAPGIISNRYEETVGTDGNIPANTTVVQPYKFPYKKPNTNKNVAGGRGKTNTRFYVVTYANSGFDGQGVVLWPGSEGWDNQKVDCGFDLAVIGI